VLHQNASLIQALLRQLFSSPHHEPASTNQRHRSPAGASGGSERGSRENSAVSTGDVRGDAEHVDEQVLGVEVAEVEEFKEVIGLEAVLHVNGLEAVKELIAGQRLSRIV